MKTPMHQVGQAMFPDYNNSVFSDLWKAFPLKPTPNLSFFFRSTVFPSIAMTFAVKAGDYKLQNALCFWLTELINKYKYQA